MPRDAVPLVHVQVGLGCERVYVGGPDVFDRGELTHAIRWLVPRLVQGEVLVCGAVGDDVVRMSVMLRSSNSPAPAGKIKHLPIYTSMERRKTLKRSTRCA